MKFCLLTISFSIALVSCTGTRPQILGIKEGRLYACPKTPNCVSSFEDPKDSEHFREALPFKGDAKQAIENLKKKIESYPRAEIITLESNYIYAEFTSLLFRFVDDVEFYVDEKNKKLHFRSASRLGKGDLGVNRKRIEALLKDLEI
ncbi:hypothetical protein LPTSP4_01980 [Leptospira ryugenii]|uniref:Lipoprotein n=1 Tax=Leptospira ryugenii TaxID=1917863 RepID=A0A2P2DVN7_9LEPT|nr:DUF1499 domain-containing protein [Leptospira ryugenii]GBF48698.1 hypothetical protein LPTSP4_01980 [Leptospira ryugenii]